jgi:hypothetical protein
MQNFTLPQVADGASEKPRAMLALISEAAA